jgi:hypothetical protein
LLRFLSSASVSVGLPPTNERAQTRNRPAGVRVSLDRQCAEVGPLIVGMSEGVENGGGGDVEDGPGGGVVLELRDATRSSERA